MIRHLLEVWLLTAASFGLGALGGWFLYRWIERTDYAFDQRDLAERVDRILARLAGRPLPVLTRAPPRPLPEFQPATGLPVSGRSRFRFRGQSPGKAELLRRVQSSGLAAAWAARRERSGDADPQTAGGPAPTTAVSALGNPLPTAPAADAPPEPDWVGRIEGEEILDEVVNADTAKEAGRSEIGQPGAFVLDAEALAAALVVPVDPLPAGHVAEPNTVVAEAAADAVGAEVTHEVVDDYPSPAAAPPRPAAAVLVPAVAAPEAEPVAGVIVPAERPSAEAIVEAPLQPSVREEAAREVPEPAAAVLHEARQMVLASEQIDLSIADALSAALPVREATFANPPAPLLMSATVEPLRPLPRWEAAQEASPIPALDSFTAGGLEPPPDRAPQVGRDFIRLPPGDNRPVAPAPFADLPEPLPSLAAELAASLAGLGPQQPPRALPPPRSAAVKLAPEERADAVGIRPSAVLPSEGPGNLRAIRGIGRGNEARLNQLGVYTVAQIAKWGEAEQRWVGAYLGFFGRVEREDWVGQARALLARPDDVNAEEAAPEIAAE